MIKKSQFKPAWWLANAHLQTMWPTLFRRKPEVVTQRERIELPDGDFIDLDWFGPENAPIVVVLHGMGGSIKSPYAKGMLLALAANGWRTVFMHFRGCSEEPNRLPRSYHSGETTDLSFLVAELQKRHPGCPIAGVGFSLGGNVLLKWLGETGEQNPLAGAVAVSVPFELENAAYRINRGLSRLYQWWILRDVIAALIKKFKRVESPLDFGDIENIQSVWEFDDRITAPLHGFADATDYYLKASSRPFLKNIQVPTLILHAIDDPFMTKDAIAEAHELSPKLILELSNSGGHVGFISGNVPWKPVYWLEQRIPEYLKEVLKK